MSVLHVEAKSRSIIGYYQGVRQKFLNLVWHKFGDDVYLKLTTMSDDVTLNVMFGAYESTANVSNSSSEDDFHCLIACYIPRLNM